MKHTTIFLLSLLFTICSPAQGVYNYTPVDLTLSLPADTSISNRLMRASDYNKLTAAEQELMFSLNYVRLHPKEFLNHALQPYLKAYPDLQKQYGESLVQTLKSMEPAGFLSIDMRLVTIARAHAADLAKNNLLSHASSNGTTTQQRFSKAGVMCGSECINMASVKSPVLELLLSLLIDFKVPDLGHRKSLLNPTMRSVGVGDAANGKSAMKYTVIDLGCDPF